MIPRVHDSHQQYVGLGRAPAVRRRRCWPFIGVLGALAVVSGLTRPAATSEDFRGVARLSARLAHATVPLGNVSLVRTRQGLFGLTHSSLCDPRVGQLRQCLRSELGGGGSTGWEVVSFAPRLGLGLLRPKDVAAVESLGVLPIAPLGPLEGHVLRVRLANSARQPTEEAARLLQDAADQVLVGVDEPGAHPIPSAPLLVDAPGSRQLVGLTRKVAKLKLAPAWPHGSEASSFTRLCIGRVFPELLDWMALREGHLRIPEPNFECEEARGAIDASEAPLLVVRTYRETPEARAGLQVGDRIVAVNEKAVSSQAELRVSYLRGADAPLELDVVRGAASPVRLRFTAPSRDELEARHLEQLLGFQLAEKVDGLEITSVPSDASGAQLLRPGDVFLSYWSALDFLVFAAAGAGDPQQGLALQPIRVHMADSIASARDLWDALMCPRNPADAVLVGDRTGQTRWLNAAQLDGLRVPIVRETTFAGSDHLNYRFNPSKP